MTRSVLRQAEGAAAMILWQNAIVKEDPVDCVQFSLLGGNMRWNRILWLNVRELAKNSCLASTASRKESLRHFLNEEIKNLHQSRVGHTSIFRMLASCGQGPTVQKLIEDEK